jgi:hypothetical protein
LLEKINNLIRNKLKEEIKEKEKVLFNIIC